MIENLIERKLLKEVCTFGIGGAARYYLEVRTIEDLQKAFEFCNENRLNYFILGKGSNCLFDDLGFHGLVIANKIDFCEIPEMGTYHVGAGYSFSLLGIQSARAQWSGLEFASGIPGSVGGAVFMNAGANGFQASDCLLSVDYLSPGGERRTLKKEELCFGYRTSSFQKMPGAITGATFNLTQSSKARQKQLEIVAYRTKTQPYSEKSAGCIFRNPERKHAGALIEQAGLKGVSMGGAAVSTKHANFIVNKGDASAQDILALIDLVKTQVKEITDINLEIEIRTIPYQGLS
jgi:UDP-N-acetylmuramate dehydrogenase